MRSLKIASTNPWDRKVRTLSIKGMTANVIAERTGLTLGQVNYRRSKLPLNERPNAYRRGESPESLALLARCDAALGTCAQLKRQIEQMLSRSRKLLARR